MQSGLHALLFQQLASIMFLLGGLRGASHIITERLTVVKHEGLFKATPLSDGRCINVAGQSY